MNGEMRMPANTLSSYTTLLNNYVWLECTVGCLERPRISSFELVALQVLCCSILLLIMYHKARPELHNVSNIKHTAIAKHWHLSDYLAGASCLVKCFISTIKIMLMLFLFQLFIILWDRLSWQWTEVIVKSLQNLPTWGVYLPPADGGKS